MSEFIATLLAACAVRDAERQRRQFDPSPQEAKAIRELMESHPWLFKDIDAVRRVIDEEQR